jgi:hypothetical protein
VLLSRFGDLDHLVVLVSADFTGGHDVVVPVVDGGKPSAPVMIH